MQNWALQSTLRVDRMACEAPNSNNCGELVEVRPGPGSIWLEDLMVLPAFFFAVSDHAAESRDLVELLEHYFCVPWLLCFGDLLGVASISSLANCGINLVGAGVDVFVFCARVGLFLTTAGGEPRVDCSN